MKIQTSPPLNPTATQKPWLKWVIMVVAIVLLSSVATLLAMTLAVNQKTVVKEDHDSTDSQYMVTPSVNITPIQSTSKSLYTVSFTRVGNRTYLRYKGEIYDDSDQLGMKPISLPNSDSSTWYDLVDAPADVDHASHDDIFSFKELPNKSGFLFIMRWTRPISTNQIQWDFPVYYYNVSQPTGTIVKVLSFIWPNTEYPVPKISEISIDGKYISFDMYGCWNCGAGKPETLVLNLATGASKRIGKTSYFSWKENGKYEYKEYKEIPCATPVEGPVICSEDPKNLPVLAGAI